MGYSILWPAYMNHPVWQNLGDAIDTTFVDSVDAVNNALKWVRTTYIPSDATESATSFKQLISFDSWTTYDQTVDIQRLNFLGLPLSEPDILREEDTTRFIQNIGEYWFEKGKGNFVDFLGYCLNISLSVSRLWTQDYVNFEPEDGAIGTTVFDGGTWYPTTHVRVTYDNSNFASTPVTKVVALFYDLCPYNLILESINSSQTLSVIRTDQTPNATPPTPAPIVFTGNITHIEQVIPSLVAS